MKTATTELVKAQAQTSHRYFYQTTLTRRLSDGTGYAIEEIDITHEVKSVGNIAWKLDTEALNVWRVGNVQIEVENVENQWNPATGTRWVGFSARWSKIFVKAGERKADGSDEFLFVFTGLVSRIDLQSGEPLARISLQSLDALIEDADAEKVSTTVNNENVGTGNGTNKDFTTANPGVGRITRVTQQGVEKLVGKDFTISQLNSKTLGAKISFKVAPSSGQIIRAKYIFWKQNQKIDDLVNDLLQSAGIGPGERQVDPIDLEGQVINQFAQTTQADWNAGVKTRVDTTLNPDDVVLEPSTLFDDFNDGNFTSNPAWSLVSGSWSASTNQLIVSGVPASGSSRLTTSANNKAKFGGWEIQIQWATASAPAQGVVAQMIWLFYNNAQGGDFGDIDLVVENFKVGALPAQRRLTATSRITGQFVQTNIGFDTSLHTILMVRENDNSVRVFLDGNAVGTIANAGSVGDASDMSVVMKNVGSPAGADADFPKIDNIKQPNLTGNLIQQVLDTGIITPITGWGAFGFSADVPAGTSLKIETQTSVNGVAYSPFEDISSTGQILSPVRRFLKARLTFESDGLTSRTPILHDTTINWFTTSFLISLANFTNLSVRRAIEELAKMPDYEWGFDASGKFFFRNKTNLGIPVMTLTDEEHVVVADAIDAGWDGVKNLIEAKFGSFTKVISPDTEGDPSPNSFDLFGQRRFSVGGSQLLIDEDVDIATGIARRIFQRSKNPKIKAQATIKFLPQLDLSDVVRLLVRNPSRDAGIGFGFWDDGGAWGDGGLWNAAEGEFWALGKEMKVKGITIDLKGFQLKLDLTEN